MTSSVVVMMIIGIIMIFMSFFITEKFAKTEENFNIDLITVDEDYEFSDRELGIIKRKIEDVIAKQAKDILYETNESLASMANEKTMALGDYAVAVCEEIEKNHKEVMFLYSMLDDKQKEIMNTVRTVNDAKQEVKETLLKIEEQQEKAAEVKEIPKRQTAIDQLSALRQMKDSSKQDQEPMKKEEIIPPELKLDSELEEQTNIIEDEMIGANSETDVTKIEHYNDSEKVNQKKLISKEEEVEDLNDVFEKIDQMEIDFDEVLEEENMEGENSNDLILELYRNGESIIEIAKQLGLGVGEVKLVIDLYQGE